MEITEVHISLKEEDKLKAFANVTFDDVFVIRGLKVIDGSNGLFVCMPSRKMNDAHKAPDTEDIRMALFSNDIPVIFAAITEASSIRW